MVGPALATYLVSTVALQADSVLFITFARSRNSAAFSFRRQGLAVVHVSAQLQLFRP